MVRLEWSKIRDARMGEDLVSALLDGAGRELWIRHERHFFLTPGTFRHELPDWANGFAAVIFSGGGGGNEGHGGNNTPGRGGTASNGAFGAYTTGAGSARATRIDITIGAGGAGGPNAKNGGQSTLYYSNQILRSGVGVFGASGDRNGTSSGWNPMPAQMARRVNASVGASMMTGAGGTGNGGAGFEGSGGAGGDGGIFGRYSNGGKGGDGFCELHIWGKIPD